MIRYHTPHVALEQNTVNLSEKDRRYFWEQKCPKCQPLQRPGNWIFQYISSWCLQLWFHYLLEQKTKANSHHDAQSDTVSCTTQITGTLIPTALRYLGYERSDIERTCQHWRTITTVNLFPDYFEVKCTINNFRIRETSLLNVSVHLEY